MSMQEVTQQFREKLSELISDISSYEQVDPWIMGLMRADSKVEISPEVGQAWNSWVSISDDFTEGKIDSQGLKDRATKLRDSLT